MMFILYRRKKNTSNLGTLCRDEKLYIYIKLEVIYVYNFYISHIGGLLHAIIFLNQRNRGGI